MPELPEVETVRIGLERHLVGRKITSVELGEVTSDFHFRVISLHLFVIVWFRQ